MAKTVTIPDFKPMKALIEIEGTSSLLCNRIPESVIATLPGGKQEGEKRTDKDRRWDEIALDGAYRDPESGAYVFPSSGIMSAIADAGYRMKLTTSAKGVLANVQIPDEWIEIHGPAPVPRQDTARNRNAGGGLIVANRAEFKKGWGMRIPVEYNSEFGLKKVGMLFEAAGFGIGIGCWRPELGGRFGRFKLRRELKEKSQ